jgi:hypothetical protein
MSLYQTVKKAYLEYLRQRERITIPRRPHDPKNSEGMVHASALGYCPLKRASERFDLPVKREMSDAELLSSYHLMEQGTRDAEPFQEAMVWKFGDLLLKRGADATEPFKGLAAITKPNMSAQNGAKAEYSVQTNEYKVRGRIDVLVQIDGELNIFELKRRDTPAKADMPEPKLSDFYQLFSYRMITGVKKNHIITLNRYFFNIWTLMPKDDGFIFVNEIGEPWDSPFNSPLWMNEETWKREVEHQHAYTFGGKTDDPMPDNNTDWQCGGWLRGERPKYYKKEWQGKLHRPEFFVPKCAYWCHSDNPTEPVEYMEEPKTGAFIPFDSIKYPIEARK